MIRKPPFGVIFTGEWCLLQVVAGDGVVEKPREIIGCGPILINVKAPGEEPKSVSRSEIAFVGTAREVLHAWERNLLLLGEISDARAKALADIEEGE